MTIQEARETIREAFQDDSNFRQTYVDNIACVIMDCIPIFKDLPAKRNEIADKIIRRIFE